MCVAVWLYGSVDGVCVCVCVWRGVYNMMGVGMVVYMYGIHVCGWVGGWVRACVCVRACVLVSSIFS